MRDPELVKGKRVLVIEDGPTLTHGEMRYGAGLVAALRHQAAEIVDPRPYACGSIRNVFVKYPHLTQVLPAMGYGDRQVAELSETIAAVPCDTVLIATPIDLAHVLTIDKPSTRVTYELEEHDRERAAARDRGGDRAAHARRPRTRARGDPWRTLSTAPPRPRRARPRATSRWWTVHSARNYAPLPVVLARGQGAWVEDVDGKRYLDMLSAYSALNFGHGHDEIVAAFVEQARTLALTSRAFHNDQFGPFCEEITAALRAGPGAAHEHGRRGASRRRSRRRASGATA